MPKVFAAMRPQERAGILLTQQVRAENMEAVSSAYKAMGLDADLASFFMDMPKRIAASHLESLLPRIRRALASQKKPKIK